MTTKITSLQIALTNVGTGATNYTDSNSALGLNALESVGPIPVSGPNAQNNTAFGYQAAKETTLGYKVTAIGAGALADGVTNSTCTAIGYGAMNNLTTGDNNVSVGSESMFVGVTNYSSVAMGQGAMYAANGGTGNVAIGLDSMGTGPVGGFPPVSWTIGDYNTAVGYNSLTSCGASDLNTAIGATAAASMTAGEENTVVGANAASVCISLTQCVAVGADAMKGTSNAVSTASVAVGYRAMYSITSTAANNNTSLGAYSMYTHIQGDQNVAIGSGAMYGDTAATPSSGSDNVIVGFQAAYSITSGSNNVAIGTDALGGGNASNHTIVGYQAGADIGNSSTGNVLLGYKAGTTISSGDDNILIGRDTVVSAITVNTEIVVGSGLTGKGTNTAFIGGTSGAYNGANVTTWATTSDARIKKNVAPISNGLEVVMALESVKFDYKETDAHDVGFIAQQYMTVLPEQVSTHVANKAQKELVGGDEVLRIQQNLVPYLVNAIQQLKAEFDAYKLAHP